MRFLRRQWARFLTSLRKQELSAQLDEEFACHIARETEANIAKGMPPETARRKALVEFGSGEAVGEACSEEHRFHLAETILADLRYALRGLLRSPIFSLTVIATLALGIGANSALFSVVNTLLLRSSLPEGGSLDLRVRILAARARGSGTCQSGFFCRGVLGDGHSKS